MSSQGWLIAPCSHWRGSYVDANKRRKIVVIGTKSYALTELTNVLCDGCKKRPHHAKRNLISEVPTVLSEQVITRSRKRTTPDAPPPSLLFDDPLETMPRSKMFISYLDWMKKEKILIIKKDKNITHIRLPNIQCDDCEAPGICEKNNIPYCHRHLIHHITIEEGLYPLIPLSSGSGGEVIELCENLCVKDNKEGEVWIRFLTTASTTVDVLNTFMGNRSIIKRRRNNLVDCDFIRYIHVVGDIETRGKEPDEQEVNDCQQHHEVNFYDCLSQECARFVIQQHHLRLIEDEQNDEESIH